MTRSKAATGKKARASSSRRAPVKKTAKRTKKAAKARPAASKQRLKDALTIAPVMEATQIEVRGAREHNLKNIDVDIPKRKLVVVTGVSGSGKSSLAFDTVFAEGQRRYVESLSSYARQFLGQMEKPQYETIRGLAPTIAIEQKAASKNPRSTVGTITEVYDYLRVLYARAGQQFCHKCGKEVGRGDAASMVAQILEQPAGTKALLLSPIVENRKGEHKDKLEELRREGLVRVRIDGVVREIGDVQNLAKHKKHNIEAVVDRLVLKKDADFRQRLTDSVETALRLGRGRLILHVVGREDVAMSEARSCCGFAFPELDPPLFSFNSPRGMCPKCNGLGTVLSMDERKLIPDPKLSIREGALLPWRNLFLNEEDKEGSWGLEKLRAIEKYWGVDYDRAWNRLPQSQRTLMLYGPTAKGAKIPKAKSKTKPPELRVSWNTGDSQGSWNASFEGMIPTMLRRFQQTKSEHMKSYYSKFMSTQACDECDGARLKPEVLAVRVGGLSIQELCEKTTREALEYLAELQLDGAAQQVAGELMKEILDRLGFLVNVGLDYLSLDRKGPTLSGGEAQRIRLASQIGSELTGVLYVLDEPSIGLHQRDNQKLLATLSRLRDLGNTLLVVEHDQETIEQADYVIDMGPGAGHLGGQVVAAGTPAQLRRDRHSMTGRYLSGKEEISVPDERRVPGEEWIEVLGAEAHNLQGVDVAIPVGCLTCITGVSGAGKSSLINHILYPALARKLHNADIEVGEHDQITGLDAIDKVINIDQRPIGRTPRSNPATYTKAFDAVRDFFAMLPEARTRGYKKGRFSFNVKGGRCEQCQGDGYLKVEMHFLADVFVPCESCGGKRFNESTLEVRYRGHSIADVLNLSVAEARELFANHIQIARILDTLLEVGLGYIKLGQAATTLSGGEAQRIKLARELAKRDTGRTLYILDEPTTGLHFEDIRRLLQVIQQLVDAGNTVVIIEHNLDVVKTADWLIDMGPEGGHGGGQVVAAGSPEQVAKVKASYTGRFVAELLN